MPLAVSLSRWPRAWRPLCSLLAANLSRAVPSAGSRGSRTSRGGDIPSSGVGGEIRIHSVPSHCRSESRSDSGKRRCCLEKAARRKPQTTKENTAELPRETQTLGKRLDGRECCNSGSSFLRAVWGWVISVLRPRSRKRDLEKGETADGEREKKKNKIKYTKWAAIPEKTQQKTLPWRCQGGQQVWGMKWDGKDRPGKFGGPSVRCARGSHAQPAQGCCTPRDSREHPWEALHPRVLHPSGLCTPGGVQVGAHPLGHGTPGKLCTLRKAKWQPGTPQWVPKPSLPPLPSPPGAPHRASC